MSKDIKLDNVKGVLIFLVVLGHTIGASKEGLVTLVNFIYSFHMPAFIFISGYFSKNPTFKKILNLLLLYFIFQSLYSVIRYFIGDFPQLQFTFGKPHTHLWYIVSLGFWYALALLLKHLPLGKILKLLLIVFILLISFYSRLYADELVEIIQSHYTNMHTQTLSILRTFVFLPFFLAGFYLQEKQMKNLYVSLQRFRFIKIGVFTLSSLIFLYLSMYPTHYDLLFYGFSGYEKFSIPGQSYITTILFHYIIGFIGIYIVLNLVNEKKSILTKWGAHSLSIFLFHMIVIFYLIRHPEWLNQLEPDIRLLVQINIALVVTILLGSTTFNRCVRFLIKPLETLLITKKFFKT
ncbi:acyltransferase family protein [Robertmurraya sp. 2P01SA]|uniref:acyltransferase family protein n=1 Tax=Robertmurraya TaxID=2837507 RepID=UPI0039A6B444